VGFTSRCEAGVKIDESPVPSEGGRQGSSEQRATEPPAPTGDVALAITCSAVVIERCEPGKRGCFFAAHSTKFGHADNERERGALTDARNAQNEIKAPSEILVRAQLPNDAQNLGCASRLQPCDVRHNETPPSWIVDVLKPGLEARNILLDLLNKRQMVRQISQALVTLPIWLIGQRREGGDESCVERIVLGAPQMHARKSTNLDWLQKQHSEALFAQISDNAALVSSRCLNTDTFNICPGQIGGQLPPAT
jgi:hypothetical protein